MLCFCTQMPNGIMITKLINYQAKKKTSSWSMKSFGADLLDRLQSLGEGEEFFFVVLVKGFVDLA
ncbi:hypothetical protein SAMN04488127_0077 [Bhargavaea ginsengi]|uniref:Uncharacterized protein n=1 Tax=Bhargavaea ginsengi TaxID=426757 RepID=A0A1H6SGB0_9BACL|nr:hypothetical protein SAMN04488127_0077 [Bhargavaea ginsengi]